MRSHALLCAAFVAGRSQATNFFHPRGFNSSSSSSSSSISSSASGSGSSTAISSAITDDDASTITTLLSESPSPTGSTNSSGITTTIHPSSSLSSNSTTLPSTNASTTTVCTGCVLEAYRPSSTWFPAELSSDWVPIVKTVGTEVTNYITYFTGTPEVIETVVTSITTVNITKTVYENNQTFAHTTPVFVVTPANGIEVTLPAGPTYLIYQSIFGGLDFLPTPTADSEETDPEETNPAKTDHFGSGAPTATCRANVEELYGLLPSDAEGWKYFIATATSVPDDLDYTPMPLPSGLVDFLKQDPGITSVFSGSDIASCTLRPTSAFQSEPLSFTETEATETKTRSWSVGLPPTFETTPPTGTAPDRTSSFLSTTYDTTTAHITKHGCLRCDTQQPIAPPTDDPMSGKGQPDPTNPKDNPVNPPHTEDKPKPNIAPTNNPNGEQRVPIGDKTYTVYPAQPTQPGRPNNNNPNQQNPTPGVVIGSQTLTPGQTGTINGIPVVVPTAGGGTKIIVGGSTIGVNPLPTGPPVLTVGETVATANSQGQFIVGGKTLTPGGPAITVDGSTLSLGPSGTVAVVNGVTQTLGNAPLVTGPPALTVDGKEISATVIGGTTQFIVGPGKTLTPGGVLTVDGTTYSLPKDGSGSTVVVNGVTSTLGAPGLPVLTLNGQSSLTATVKDGTTEFVLGPGKTLTPGGVLTVDGTTYSLPKGGSGSTVVVNGVTSTLGGLPVLTLNSQSSITATVEGGTTAFILGPGKTLTPGGVLTVSGTTYSVPASASGSVIVINGQTSTLGHGPITAAAALTINGKTYSPTVRDGTTEYVLGPGKTLKPGQAVTVDGTTYSLDPKGTALVINGKTSTLPKTPASNSATTTKSSSSSASSSESSSTLSSSTTQRQPGNFIASGFGISSKGGAVPVRGGGFDKWVESAIIGFAGWILMLV